MPITRKYRRVADHLQRVGVRDGAGAEQLIQATDEHPFFVPGQRWTKSKLLETGDGLLGLAEIGSSVTGSTRQSHHAGVVVYNMEVAGSHTYFVRAEDSDAEPVWVHNADYSGTKIRNGHLAGDVHPDTKVRFNRNGFPIFDSLYDTRIGKALYRQTDYVQFQRATCNLYKAIQRNRSLEKQFTPRQLEQISAGVTPDGFTWHHHQKAGRMQLVDSEVHRLTGHTGGREIWGGGGEYR